jgi:hypothetical protein
MNNALSHAGNCVESTCEGLDSFEVHSQTLPTSVANQQNFSHLAEDKNTFL